VCGGGLFGSQLSFFSETSNVDPRLRKFKIKNHQNYEINKIKNHICKYLIICQSNCVNTLEKL